jgi:hypothetical protein
MHARLVSGLVVLALAGAVVATATSLSITSTRLGGGTANVTACDSNGFSYRYTVDLSERITSVAVSNIDLSCAGGVLRLTLASSGSSVGGGSASLPSSGFTGDAAIAISPTPLSATVTAAHAVIEGP